MPNKKILPGYPLNLSLSYLFSLGYQINFSYLFSLGYPLSYLLSLGYPPDISYLFPCAVYPLNLSYLFSSGYPLDLFSVALVFQVRELSHLVSLRIVSRIWKVNLEVNNKKRNQVLQ